MKSTKPTFLKNLSNFVFALVILFTYSCAPDETDSQANAEAMKSRNAIKAKEIARGALIRGTNGINFGPDDNLYIASFYGQEVVAMNKQNGKILRRYSVLEDGNPPFGPDDLIFHPDGESFYFTDITTGFVGRMAVDGTPLGYQEVAPGVNPITFTDSPPYRLFVGLDFQGDGLYELDPNLVNPPRAIVPDDGDPNTFPLGFLNAFDFGPDGRLYGPSFLFRQIISVDVEAGPTTDPYGDGTAIIVNDEDDWEYPVAAKFGPDGLLTVLDQNGKVWKLNHETGVKTLFTTLQPGLDNLAFDSEGNLYISNADFGWIIQILPSGQARTISRGGMIGPQGVAVLPGKNNKDAVFVGDLFRMRNFSGRTGKEEEIFKGYLVPEPDKLTMPFSVHADEGNLIVTSWFSGLVQSWNPDRDEVDDEYQFFVPIDAVRINGEILVSELVLGGVVKASDGSLIAPLDVASGLATDGTSLWAADWLTGDIWRVDFDNGTPLQPEKVAIDILQPEGMAFENEESLLVVETGSSSLLRIDLTKNPGENVTTVVENLQLSAPWIPDPNSVPTWYFDGVAVGPSGDIYVTGGGANVLYRISKE
jgi:sugar lactone lactonase YvrE